MLKNRGIAFQETRHRGACTAQEVAEREHVSGHRVAKVVVVMADATPVELVLPATRKVDLDRIRALLKATDARLATEDEMERFFSDCEVGAVPPLRHWKDVPVIMDNSLRLQGEILFQAGTHTDAIRLNFQDWYNLVHPQTAAFSQPLQTVRH
jgi:Ala-tRNA(Pro) deacylase